MPQRTNRTDRRRRAPDHPAGVLPDRLDTTRLLVDRDDGRFEDGDAATANEDQRVRRAEIDRKLATPMQASCSHSTPTNTSRVARTLSQAATGSDSSSAVTSAAVSTNARAAGVR